MKVPTVPQGGRLMDGFGQEGPTRVRFLVFVIVVGSVNSMPTLL